MVTGSRRSFLTVAGAAVGLTVPVTRVRASDSDFWNKKQPADWTPREIARLLKDSPWAKDVTPVYISLPPPMDNRPWNETPPIGRGPSPRQPPRQQKSFKAPYHAIVRWESAEPVRIAEGYA